MSSDFEHLLRTRLLPLDGAGADTLRSDRALNPDWEGPARFRLAAALAAV